MKHIRGWLIRRVVAKRLAREAEGYYEHYMASLDFPGLANA